MPIVEVKAPDGSVLEIQAPEGASDDDILSYAKSQFDSAPRQTPETSGVAINSFNKGMAGALDQVINAFPRLANIGTVAHGEITGEPVQSMEDPRLHKDPNYVRRGFEAAGFIRPELNPSTPVQGYLDSMMQGAGGAITMGPQASISGNTANLAAGAASSLASDAAYDATGDVGASLLAGIAAPGAVGRIADPKVSKQVAMLLKEGVTPTIGQIKGGVVNSLEEKLGSVPFIGELVKGARNRSVDDLNRAAYNRALTPIGTSAEKLDLPVGREGVAGTKDALSTRFNEILPKLTFKADQGFIDDLASLSASAKHLPEKEAGQLEKYIDRYLSMLSAKGTMTGREFQDLYSEMGSEIKGLTSSSSQYERDLGYKLKNMQSSYDSALERSNPEYIPDLKAIRSGYSNYAILRNAAKNVDQAETGFTPKQLARAVRQSDSSVGKGATATGTASMQDLSDAGVNVLGNKIPDSGTAGRNAINKAVAAAILGGGAMGGGASFIVPATIGGAALSAPYTKTGQKAMAAILAKRPEGVRDVARHLSDSEKQNLIMNLKRLSEEGNN